jgi:hypothetical protein
MTNKLAVGMLLLVLMSGCYDPHAQQSAVVREVEAAGSGNLDTSTADGLKDFFGNHPKLANKISAECVPFAKKADAHWVETAEGRTCLAAHAMAQTDWKADPRAW